MGTPTRWIIVLMIISILLISAFVLYANQPGGETAEQKEKPKEGHIEVKETKPHGADRFGFVCFNEYALKDLNLGWVRPHPGPFIWGRIERVRGKYDFSEADKLVKMAQEMGLNILATIWPYAEWDQKRWGRTNITVIQDFPELPRSRFKPYDMEAYRAFVKALIERYDGDGVNDMPGLRRPIKYWEVLNEPSTGFNALSSLKAEVGIVEIHAFFVGNADDYLEILKVTYKAIKEADSEAKVLNGGMIPLPPRSEDPFYDFWMRVFKLGGGRYFDILNLHALSKKILDTIPKVREAFGEYIGGKPIWFTEFSAESPQIYMEAIKVFGEGAERIFYTAYQAKPGAPKDLIIGSLIDMKGKPKPSYYAVKTILTLLGDFDHAEKISSETYKFKRGQVTIYALWDTPPKGLKGKVLLVDMLGRARIVEVGDVPKLKEGYFLVVGEKRELERIMSKLSEITPPKSR